MHRLLAVLEADLENDYSCVTVDARHTRWRLKLLLPPRWQIVLWILFVVLCFAADRRRRRNFRFSAEIVVFIVFELENSTRERGERVWSGGAVAVTPKVFTSFKHLSSFCIRRESADRLDRTDCVDGSRRRRVVPWFRFDTCPSWCNRGWWAYRSRLECSFVRWRNLACKPSHRVSSGPQSFRRDKPPRGPRAAAAPSRSGRLIACECRRAAAGSARSVPCSRPLCDT